MRQWDASLPIDSRAVAVDTVWVADAPQPTPRRGGLAGADQPGLAIPSRYLCLKPSPGQRNWTHRPLVMAIRERLAGARGKTDARG